MSTTTCTTNQRHCEQCGSTDYEDLIDNDGYSACCNEIIAACSSDCDGGHVADAAFQSQLDEAMVAAGFPGHNGRNEFITANGLPAFDAIADAINARVYGR